MNNNIKALPETEEIRKAYEQVSYTRRLRRSVVSTVNILIVVAAIAVIVATLLLPILRIYGDSMRDTLDNGDLVVSVKGASFDTGDVIAFYYNNNILVKRVIAGPGQWVDIDADGNVYVDQQAVEEPYLKEKAYGDPDIMFPYQVPDDRFFVMGDNRAVSVDSRNTSVGCVSTEQIVGKIILRIWPLNRIGTVN
ncbi:MAG: signal peptidase I [Firmicutes bacterium]|nr:signal peptidase I [Bacillota bacterium]